MPESAIVQVPHRLRTVWLLLGGHDNTVRFLGASRKALAMRQAAFKRHDERVARRTAEVEAYNANVERDGAGIAERNARTGEDIPSGSRSTRPASGGSISISAR